MIIAVPSRGIPSRMRTHHQIIASGLDYVYVTHNEAGFDGIRSVGIPSNNIVIADNCPFDHPAPRIGWMRDWIETKFTSPKEWICMMDDNTVIEKLIDPWYFREHLKWGEESVEGFEWRQWYRTPLRPEDLHGFIYELIHKCAELGTSYGGLAAEDNYYFRPRKWVTKGYVKAKFSVSQNIGVPWVYDDRFQVYTDWARSIDRVARHGCIAINRFSHARFVAWEAGGIGSLEERLPFILPTIKALKERFNGLIEPWKDHEWKIQFIRSQKRIEQWRRDNGWSTPRT